MFTVAARNLGPIIEGTVEVKPLTIFIGPSNTGKSYMATAIWAVAKGFRPESSGSYPFHIWERFNRLSVGSSREGNWDIPELIDVLSTLQEWLEGQGELGEDAPIIHLSELPDSTQKCIRNSIQRFLIQNGHTAIENLTLGFGEDHDIARHGRPEDFAMSVNGIEPPFSVDLCLDEPQDKLVAFDLSGVSAKLSPYKGNRRMSFRVRRYLAEERPDLSTVYSTLAGLEMETERALQEELPPNCFYLPAGRTGIVQAQRVLASAFVRQSRRIGIEPMNVSTLPGMAAEFLSDLLSVDTRERRRRARKPELTAATSFIEEKVLQGEVDLDESAGPTLGEIVYTREDNQGQTHTYSLEHTSSMVSELAPLILFLKYLVNPGDLLIIEEPESHLHPAAQRQMARGIVRLVNAGVRVLVTTHSEFMISQLNNLRRINYASDRWLKKNGFTREDCLKHDDISAYAFRWDKEEGGSRAEPLEIRKDVGIDEDEFALVANDLYEETIVAERIRPR